MKSIGPNIWTLDGPQIIFAGVPMHTRMTVVKLQDGTLWLHSPIDLTEEIKQKVNTLGDVGVLVAPNKYHYLYLQSWQQAYPQAHIFVEAGLRKKILQLAEFECLTNDAPSCYAGDIDQVNFRGNRMFQEVVFFHKESRTLILTDLMVNLKSDGMGWLARWWLKFEQIEFPNGGVMRLYRWFTTDRQAAREALATIKAWSPQQIAFCHGESFDIDAQQVLQREFDWLENKNH